MDEFVIYSSCDSHVIWLKMDNKATGQFVKFFQELNKRRVLLIKLYHIQSYHNFHDTDAHVVPSYYAAVRDKSLSRQKSVYLPENN